MPNPITNIQITLDFINGHRLQWWVNPTFSAPGPYQFAVLAYQDSSFSEVIYTITAGTSFYAIDTNGVKKSAIDSFFYRIQLTDANGAIYLSDFADWRPTDRVNTNKYCQAAEIVRKEWVRFRRAGQFGYLLKRKYYADKVTAEVDLVTQEPIIDHGSTTFGVGLSGGYFTPVLFMYSISGRDADLDLADDGRGTQYVEQLKIRTAGFPFLDSHDIVISREGKRYKVNKQELTLFPGTNIYIVQENTMQLVPMTDSIYEIPCPPFPINE